MPRRKTSSGLTLQTEDESSINPKPKKGTIRRTQRSRNAQDKVKKVLPEVEAACQEFVDHHTKLDVLRQEFKQLSEMVVDDKSHLKCCANRERNRYENIPCLDATRLVLQNEDGGNDFIHANKCTFDKSDRDFYIITQAPIKNTIEDFWRAVFQESSPSIVVLCVFYEQGRESSESFWPLANGEYKYYGKMFINNKKVEHMDNVNVYTIEVLPDGCSNSLVTIYHFGQWEASTIPNGNSQK